MTAFSSGLKGLLRKAFYAVFAYVKRVDVLGPSIVRELPTDSPYQAWLERVKADVPIHAGTMIDDVATFPLRPWPQLGPADRRQERRIRRGLGPEPCPN